MKLRPANFDTFMTELKKNKVIGEGAREIF